MQERQGTLKRSFMHGNYLASDQRFRLAAFVEARRRDVVVAILRASSESPRTVSLASNAFINAFLDRLCGELHEGSRDLDIWCAGESDRSAADRGRLITISCGVVAKAYGASHAGGEDVSEYVVRRGEELLALLQGEPEPAEPAQVVVTSGRDEAVTSLLSAMEAHDSVTANHARAVGVWSGRIAKALGLGREEQSMALLCGTLHDVGKIATPTEILLKTGPLDDDERIDMQAHALVGARMLERIPSLCCYASVVCAHHERMDGSGYPNRLAGDAIPPVARIVAVADAFHAMINKRPYRDALELARVIDIIRCGAGAQWDAQVVDALLGIVRPVGVRPAELRAETAS
jgi:putative nucleotidyltransferase with HDIG domain